MSGYRPDDVWSQTAVEDRGLPLRWVILAAVGVSFVAILAGLIGRFSIGRILSALFALVFVGLVALSVRAIGIGARHGYFEARWAVVRRADQPWLFRIYFGLHLLLIPFCLAIAIGCAGLSYLDPWN